MQVAIIAGAGNGIGPILAVADGPTEVHQVQVAQVKVKVKVKVMSKPENIDARETCIDRQEETLTAVDAL